MTGNAFVAFFLRTPLRVFLGDTMLITVTGLKTGRKYSTPVGFYQDGNCLWVLTSRDRTWWRNVRNGADVSLLLRGKTVQAFAQAELEEESVMARLQEYIGRIPMARRSLGVRMENQEPDRVDLARVAKDRLFVKVSLPR
ncbi:MAG TPA: nitroreductase/quinone reductase family protein [Anaerolineales bacterium]|nr:nitroreductase/quinone reductase family protein [Anaerolineales bacterium]